MFNWRRPVVYTGLFLAGSKLQQCLRTIQQLAARPWEEVKHYQAEQLKQLLRHAWRHVPYYHDLLERAGVIVNHNVLLENFPQIPVLTKDIIRNKGNALYSDDYRSRRSYDNTSGGSTGEPVRLLQDQQYSDWNIANTLYYRMFVGVNMGDLEVRLWGSERDILVGRETLQRRLRDWLFNRIDVNAFRMTPTQMKAFVTLLNEKQPPWIEAYAHPLYEFAKFVKEHCFTLHSPRGVLTSAGTLYPHMQALIEEVFQCKTFNRYGSREVGGMACNCEKQEGLHLSPWNHYFEILDEDLNPVQPRAMGRVYVTVLHNYSMPLIRYDIGDIAVQAERGRCSCVRQGMPLIQSVRGRDVSVFKTRNGDLIDGEFFTHLFYLRDWCQKFQVIQKDYDAVLIKLVLIPGSTQRFIHEQQDITDGITKVLGQKCTVDFQVVDEIPPNPSGKYAYTISEVI